MKKHKSGDIVTFGQCWEDEAKNYHDESAEIVAIKEDGSLELNWLITNKEIRDGLKQRKFYLSDISY